MMIEETIVEAKNLSTWMKDCYERGGEVKFIVPAKYVLTQQSTWGVQSLTMDVETYRVLWMTLPARYAAGWDHEED